MRAHFLGDYKPTHVLEHNDLVRFMRGEDGLVEVEDRIVVFGNLPVVERCLLRHQLMALKPKGVMGDGSWRITTDDLDERDAVLSRESVLQYATDNLADVREALPDIDEDYDEEYDDWDTHLLTTIEEAMAASAEDPHLFYDDVFSGQFDVCGARILPTKRQRYSRAVALTVLVGERD
jgi:hypothetical protein